MANEMDSDSDGSEFDIFGLGAGVTSLSTEEEDPSTAHSEAATLLASLEHDVLYHQTSEGLSAPEIHDMIHKLANGEYLRCIENRYAQKVEFAFKMQKQPRNEFL